jgi:hypothetical protein
MTNSGPRPMLAYWHLWTDAEGVSHQQRCELTAFELKGVGPADPQRNDQRSLSRHRTLNSSRRADLSSNPFPTKAART